jgi:putrescine aminotransferase
MRACGDHIVSAPPLIITREEIDQMLGVAARCVETLEKEALF